MSALYQISQQYQAAINDALIDDEISINQVDALNKLEGELEDKAVAIASYIKN